MQHEQQAMFNFEPLKMYYDYECKINDKITIRHPTIGEISDWGESKYFNMINMLCSIPSDMKAPLYDNGIDWEEISDFDYFISISHQYSQEDTSIILGDLDFSKLKIGYSEEINQTILYDEKKGIQIDFYVYQKMIDYIRNMHGIVPCVEKAFNKRTKMALIELNRQELNKHNKGPTSMLRPLISSMVNSAGFKYDIEGSKRLTIVQFMDSVQRIPLIMSTTALLHGINSGMVDVKKIDKKEFNWMREIIPQNQKGENLKIPNQNSK